jgi:hypothetical protein
MATIGGGEAITGDILDRRSRIFRSTRKIPVARVTFSIMNGVHDVGGMHGFGEVDRAPYKAEQRPEPFEYYPCWLAAFEDVLERTGLVLPLELRERTSEFEFGERADIF